MKNPCVAFSLVLFTLASCGTLTIKSIPTWTPRLLRQQAGGQAMNYVITPAGAIKADAQMLEAARLEDIAARRVYLKELSDSHADAVLAAQKTLEGMREAATRYSALNFAIGGTGILSGIASAVLVAASPANAAVVAGFNALTTGVVGFQTLAGNEGFSRASVAAAHKAVFDELRGSESHYQDAYVRLTMTADEVEWETNARKAEAAVGNLARIALWVPMPDVAAKPSS